MMTKTQTDEIPSELLEIIIGMIRTVSAKAGQMEITPESILLDELELDSLDLVRVIMLIEDRYHVAIDLDEVPKMRQVRDLVLTLVRQSRSAA
jgi:acyl carrier protein